MKQAEIRVKTWSGEERAAEQTKLSAERDKEGRVFYKITGFWISEDRQSKETFMIDYTYERTKAMRQYNKILNDLLDAQEAVLKNGAVV